MANDERPQGIPVDFSRDEPDTVSGPLPSSEPAPRGARYGALMGDIAPNSSLDASQSPLGGSDSTEKPATPLPPTESLRVPVHLQSSDSADRAAAPPGGTSPPGQAPAPTAAATQVLATPTERNPSLEEARSNVQKAHSPEQRDNRTLLSAEAYVKGPHTTLESMKRPDQGSGGVPHSRRFLHIENELDQVAASVRLVEKSLERMKNEVRFAWIVALLAAALAGAALAL